DVRGHALWVLLEPDAIHDPSSGGRQVPVHATSHMRSAPRVQPWNRTPTGPFDAGGLTRAGSGRSTDRATHRAVSSASERARDCSLPLRTSVGGSGSPLAAPA